jgi:hypothetical protein
VSCPLRYIHPGQRYTNQLLPSWESRLTDGEVGRLIAHFQKDHPDTMKRCRKRDFLASQVILKALRGIGYNYHAIIQMVVHSYEKLGRYVDLEQLAQSTVRVIEIRLTITRRRIQGAARKVVKGAASIPRRLVNAAGQSGLIRQRRTQPTRLLRPPL